MAQTTTNIGRSQVAHPDLGYDTADGGVNLHAALNTMFTKFSDNDITRYFSQTFTNGQTVNFTHNFNMKIGNLKIYLSDSNGDILDQTSWTIAQVSLNAISIQNNTGSEKTVSIVILGIPAGGGNTILVGPVALTGTYSGNVLVEGNATYGAGTIIKGDLVVTGNLSNVDNNSGTTIDVYGNLFVNGSATFNYNASAAPTIYGDVNVGSLSTVAPSSGAGGSFTAKGNLISRGAISMNGFSSGNGGALTVGGHCLLQGNLSTKGAGNPGSGGNINVVGMLFSSSAGDIDASASTTSVSSGGSVTASGIYGYVKTYGGNGATSGGNGGNISCRGDLLGSIRCSGGNGSSGSGGAAGSIVVRGSIGYSSGIMIDAYGGNGTTTGGAGGAITVLGNIRADYISNSGGNGGTGSGGSSGSVDIQGNVHMSGAWTSQGGTSTGSNGGNANTITVGGNFSCASFSANGGGGAGSGYGGNGSNCTFRGNFHSQTSVSFSGGAGGTAGGGYGGGFECYGNCSVQTTFHGNGGNGTTSGAGGSGQTALFWGPVTIGGNATLLGGSGGTSGVGGNGGSLTCRSFARLSLVDTSGGGGFGALKNAGVGGAVTFHGDCVLASSLTTSGGTASSTGNGGNAGSITFNGHAKCGDVYSLGGGTTGGTAGAPGNISILAGGVFPSVYLKEGSGSSPGLTRYIRFMGAVVIETLDVSNVANCTIEGFSGTILRVTYLNTKNVFKNPDATSTAALAPLNKLYICDAGTGKWTRLLGATAD